MAERLLTVALAALLGATVIHGGILISQSLVAEAHHDAARCATDLDVCLVSP